MLNSDEQKRLEVAGWRVGMVQEFLELPDDEALQVERELQEWLKQKNEDKPLPVA